jgi:hypothetical protein
VLCPNCKTDNNRVRHRSGAIDNQLKQATMMVARSKKELGTPEVGQTVPFFILEMGLEKTH